MCCAWMPCQAKADFGNEKMHTVIDLPFGLAAYSWPLCGADPPSCVLLKSMGRNPVAIPHVPTI